jgi:hypothetical protein
MVVGEISLDTVKFEELRKVIGLDPLVDLIEISLGDLDEMVFPVFRGKPDHVGPNTSGIVTSFNVAPHASTCIPVSRQPIKGSRAIKNT